MPNRVLVGLPELAPERHLVRLVTSGPYARVRHPRYIEFALAIFAFCLVSNYLTLYIVCALWVAAIYLIVFLEERELSGRFGEEYEAYRRRVSMWVHILAAAFWIGGSLFLALVLIPGL